MKRYFVQVTEQDIKLGQRFDHPRSKTCPVTRALKRVLGREVAVTANGWTLVGDQYGRIGQFPKKVVKFIDDADRNEAEMGGPRLKPFYFSVWA